MFPYFCHITLTGTIHTFAGIFVMCIKPRSNVHGGPPRMRYGFVPAASVTTLSGQ